MAVARHPRQRKNCNPRPINILDGPSIIADVFGLACPLAKRYAFLSGVGVILRHNNPSVCPDGLDNEAIWSRFLEQIIKN